METTKQVYVAHRSPDGRLQPALEHLNGVAEKARQFASAFGAGQAGYYCGLLHDIGKYSDKAQKRIKCDGPIVDHSTAGAQEACRLGMLYAAYCIAGHHGGIPNGGSRANSADEPTLFGRLQKNVEDCGAYMSELEVKKPEKLDRPIKPMGQKGFSYAFFIRMLYSCLVDADFLDTEKFMSGGGVERPTGDSIGELFEMYRAYIKRFDSPETDIDRIRCGILQSCLEMAEGEKGLYTLTVPTGGGKTISSLGFALRHAVKHGLRRVIYVIPYTSIIDQNAEVFEKILGVGNVLRHYSGYVFDDDAVESAKMQLASENWDLPVIVTTNVQFFESLFSNKPSKCRKLHNIANSVIIFDEAQMIPYPYLKPCVRAIAELIYNYGCTAVLCSATQPELGKLFPAEIKATEICPNYPELYVRLERVRYADIGETGLDKLAERLNGEKQALCIVNTRKQAQKLYEKLKNDGAFHLSTLMHPEHRRETLEVIRYRLRNGLACRVVSTSVVEAGVDVDFPAVYREEAGLDSIIQAGGRCNREGKRKPENSFVHIFRFDKESSVSWPSSLRLPAEAARAVLSENADIASPEAIREYFELMHALKGERLDAHKIVQAFEAGAMNDMSFPFSDVAETFKLIEEDTTPVLICNSEMAKAVAEQIRREVAEKGWCGRETLRLAGRYSVSIYKRELADLYRSGKVDMIADGLYVLLSENAYSSETGLSIAKDEGVGHFV